MSPRIGPRMQDVVRYVAANPGLPMIRAAKHVGPRGSLKFGYRTVHRALNAGLIVKSAGPRGSWLLEIAR